MVKRRARLNEDNDPLNSTERVLAGLEEAGNPGKPKDEEVNYEINHEVDHEANNVENQEVETFLISQAVLEQLENLRLQLQFDLGARNIPQKEIKAVIIEEAIAQLLNLAQTEREDLIELLHKRQKSREI